MGDHALDRIQTSDSNIGISRVERIAAPPPDHRIELPEE